VAALSYFRGRGGEVGNLPLMDFYQVVKVTGWSWRDWQEMPKPVRTLFVLYAQMEAIAATKDK
jgi:hypothetical protein